MPRVKFKETSPVDEDSLGKLNIFLSGFDPDSALAKDMKGKKVVGESCYKQYMTEAHSDHCSRYA